LVPASTGVGPGQRAAGAAGSAAGEYCREP
jgi:hypothetical protein